MVNISTPHRTTRLPLAGVLVPVYVAITVVTLLVLAVLAKLAPDQATSHAWGHAIVVVVFAVVLPLRLRSARHGDRSAVRAVGLIASVLFLVNVVEALIPDFVPTWMRWQMVVVALLMLGVVLDVVRWAVTTKQA